MKSWNVKLEEIDPSLGNSREEALLYSILKSRGVEEKDFKTFLNPKEGALSTPDIFADIERAKERILKAVSNKELILIWGDFDADGVTSTSILYKTLTELGANFDYIIPDREKMGHGLNTKVLLPYIAKKKPKVLITVDCGISNVKEVALLKGFGVDVILTDHHKAPDTLPEAYAILNPKAQNSLREDLSVNEIQAIDELCGAGVAFKLASALLEENENQKLKDEILVLACVGTIADVVPLLGENRIITARGLELVNKGAHKGINLLFKQNDKTDEITSYDIAFVLAPRINAVGRLATADCAFKLLTEENETTLEACIKELTNYNNIRQNLCDDTFSEAMAMISKDPEIKSQKGIILFNEKWHIGIIGIVASKIVEKFYKPVFLITKDDENMARCSIRGIKEYNIAQILDENGALFSGHGGHALAGGFSFDLNTTSFETVKKAILATLDSKDDVEIKGPKIDIDAVLEPEFITENLVEELKKLEPTGQMNPSPVFGIKDLILKEKKTMGKEGNHLSFRVQKGSEEFSCVWWRHSEIPVNTGENFDLAFEARLNSFNGQTSVRLYTVDVKSQRETEFGQSGLKFYDHRQKTGILAQIEEYVKRPNTDIAIYAKKITTKGILKDYPVLTSKIPQDNNFNSKDIMFFDYPSLEDLRKILITGGFSKVHLMKEDFEINIEHYIKQLIGMLKFASNNKNGEISIKNFADITGTSEEFIQNAIEILDELGAIEALDVDKINFIAPPKLEEFYQNKGFAALKDEFERIIENKKYIAQMTLDDIEKLIQ